MWKKRLLREDVLKDFESLKDDKDMSLLLEYFHLKVARDKLSVEEIKELAYYYQLLKNGASTITDSIYANSNENLKKLFKYFDVIDKRVATVGSSGDQALNAIYLGAKEVDLIDANLFTRSFVELKIAAIKVLSYKDFLNWIENVRYMFTFENEYYQYYAKISHALPDDVKLFWDEMILNEMGIEDYYFAEFFLCDDKFYVASQNACYAYESNFNRLKHILISGNYKLNISFGEMADFPKKLNGKYDLILLSNLVDYCNLREYNSIVRELYSKNLNEYGSIQLTTSSLFSYELEALAKEEGGVLKKIYGCGCYDDVSIFLQKPKEKNQEIMCKNTFEKTREL